jgi:hypothetical protein
MQAVHPVESLPSFLERILEWSVDYAETTAQRAAAFAIVATVVNKHVDGQYGTVSVGQRLIL